MVTVDKEARAALKRKEKAKVALLLCTQIERSEIFRELGICNCANITKEAVKHPAAVVGALVGALAGIGLKTMLEKKSKPEMFKKKSAPLKLLP